MTEDQSSQTEVASSSESNYDGPQRGEATLDELLRLLANARRRRLLSYLTTRPGDPISTDDLIDAVAEREQSEPGPAAHWTRITIALYHVHLPKLADAGVVDYDPVAETVRYDKSQALEALLAASTAVEGSPE